MAAKEDGSSLVCYLHEVEVYLLILCFEGLFHTLILFRNMKNKTFSPWLASRLFSMLIYFV